MRLLFTLLSKDLLRIRRKPTAILIQIGISLLLVTMIGLAFGGSASGGSSGMAPIKIAIVDEDESGLTQLLEGATGNPEMAEHLDIYLLDREEALAMLAEGELSAALIFPKGMTDRFFGGGEVVEIELVKNPAQSVYPAIVEEGIEALITVLNAVSRSFRDDLVELRKVLNEGLSEDAFYSNAVVLAGVWADTMVRLESIKEYLNPPLVWFESETLADAEKEESGSGFDLFAFVYVGLGATFLLMIASNVTSDIYREGRFGTLRRFSSIRNGTLVFVVEKAILVVTVLLIAAVVMFWGSSLVFRFEWREPVAVSSLLFCYAVCGAGLTSLIASFAGKEKRADTINVFVLIGIALLGGGMIQSEILPGFVQNYITPFLPTAWFIGPARAMQTGAADVPWVGDAIKLLVFGGVSIVASSFIFHKRVQRNGGVG
ncbi:hypothetical protein VDG1235_4653 [Verrucomicrobiia bacterium DG1235]|nr:hypothetical protein VDG1235_4653 [Verrucomicrobiae bacterium DG1235]